VEEIRIYQNGKMIGSIPVNEGDPQKRKFNIALVDGDNEIKVTAFDANRTEALPDQINITYEGVKKTSDLYILTVGINNYRNSTYNLQYAYPDAKSFLDNFSESSKTIFNEVKTYFISDAEATKDNILATYEKIATQASSQDVFVFYYAGHGILLEDQSENKNEFYLILHDIIQATSEYLIEQKGLSASKLIELSRNIKAQKQLFILDACHSGQVAEQFVASRGFAEEKAIMQLARSAGIFVLSASGVEQYAQEITQLAHGVFTYSILEGLEGLADIQDEDDIISIIEIMLWTSERVPDLIKKYRGLEQYPKIYIKGDDFPISIVKKK
jgi:CRISPR/Cas system endoribonuclease Cas6 (RAMP superfamily)